MKTNIDLCYRLGQYRYPVISNTSVINNCIIYHRKSLTYPIGRRVTYANGLELGFRDERHELFCQNSFDMALGILFVRFLMISMSLCQRGKTRYNIRRKIKINVTSMIFPAIYSLIKVRSSNINLLFINWYYVAEKMNKISFITQNCQVL